MANVEQTILALETSIFVQDEDKCITPSRLIDRGRRRKTRRGSRYPVRNCNNPKRKMDTRFYNRLCKVFLIVYAIWISLIDLKFQHEKGYPFRAQWFFFITSPIALCITLLGFWLLFHTKNTLRHPDMIHKILKSVIYFFGILAHLSLVLLFFIPPKLNWVGYSIISGLFVVMIVYTFHNHIMTLAKKISTTWERITMFKGIKTSSCSSTIINV